MDDRPAERSYWGVSEHLGAVARRATREDDGLSAAGVDQRGLADVARAGGGLSHLPAQRLGTWSLPLAQWVLTGKYEPGQAPRGTRAADETQKGS